MKTLIPLLLASTACLTLVGCGETSEISNDKTVLSTGENNQTSFGGFWWTYVDRAIGATPRSTVVPDTGKKSPEDTTTPMPAGSLNAGFAAGNGIADDGMGTGNLAFNIQGQVRSEPTWSPTLGDDGKVEGDTYGWKDPYWDAWYAKSVCVGSASGGCGEVKYPAAGGGFGFQLKNRPTDLSEYLGVAFKFRHDPSITDVAGSLVNISMPMDLTDVPDPSYGDEFGNLPGGAPGTRDDNSVGPMPFCTFPHSPGSTPQTKTCFKNFGAVIPNQNNTGWSENCMVWSQFLPPTWGSEVMAADGVTPVTVLDQTRVTKLQFDAPKLPTETPATAKPFNFWVDDVVLLTCENWDKYCANSGAVKPACTPTAG